MNQSPKHPLGMISTDLTRFEESLAKFNASDCRTCEYNDADVAGDGGACVMGHGVCTPPRRECPAYVAVICPKQSLTS